MRIVSIANQLLSRTDVESVAVIHEDVYVELLELLELYSELLIARFGLLDQK